MALRRASWELYEASDAFSAASLRATMSQDVASHADALLGQAQQLLAQAQALHDRVRGGAQ